jgi:hypothetical protein
MEMCKTYPLFYHTMYYVLLCLSNTKHAALFNVIALAVFYQSYLLILRQFANYKSLKLCVEL